MKTLVTAALVAALALGTSAGAREPGKPQAAPPAQQGKGKPADKKVTAEELCDMLQAMGIETRPFTNKEGKVVGCTVKYQSEGWTIVGDIEVRAGNRIWIRGWFADGLLDEKTPAPLVLALLGTNDRIFPAVVMHSPKSKTFFVFMEVQNGNVTPTLLRTTLDQYTAAIKATLTAYDTAKAKYEAIEKEKAEEVGKK